MEEKEIGRLIAWADKISTRKNLPKGKEYLGSREKRRLEVVTVGTVLPITVPLELVAALAVRTSDGLPAWIRLNKILPGEKEKRITYEKIRTMRVGAENDELRLIPKEMDVATYKRNNKDPRVTRIGAWLRRLSLDELPQLRQVAKGELALAGPRAAGAADLRHIKQNLDQEVIRDYRRMWDEGIMPGLTSLPGVRGRGDLDFTERAGMDVWYAQNASLLVDMAIILETIPTVLLRRGAY